MINKLKIIFNKFDPYINGWEDMKRASVAIIILEENGEENVIFQVRSKKMKSQPGDISFTGGKIDKDETPKEAIVREIWEEIGLDINDFDIITELDTLVTHYGLIIHPFIVYIKNMNNIKINKSEVDHIFSVPLKFLYENKPTIINNEILIKRNEKFPFELINNGENYKFKNGIYPSLFYIYNEYVIWGITAKILENFIKELNKKNYFK